MVLVSSTLELDALEKNPEGDSTTDTECSEGNLGMQS